MFTKGYSNCQSRDVNTHAANVGAEENPTSTRLFSVGKICNVANLPCYQ